MKRFLTISLIIFINILVLGTIAGAGLIFWASRDLPSFTRISDYRPALVTTVYARDGSIIGYFYSEKRFKVSLGQMPPYLWQAFLSAEDSGFYKHSGIDPKAIVRAFYKNLSSERTEGGSTITQQVVKRLLLTPERSYTRKLKEAILAYRLERYLTKDDILDIYLNQIFLGNGAYGVEAAARTYFGKHVEELTLAEAAVIAGLPQSPSKVNPYTDEIATKDRQRYVLRRMLDDEIITHEEYREALQQPLIYTSMPDPSWKTGAWYLEEVRRKMIDFLSEQNVRDLNLPLETYGQEALYTAGLHIYTSMDPVHQQEAEIALRQGLLNTTKRHGWRGPVQKIPPAEIENYLKKDNFTPQVLDNAGWAKAVVVKVSNKQADVRLGAFTGVIEAKNMEWCRVPNPALAPEDSNQIRTPDKILAVGDVIWVSAIGASGNSNPVGVPAGPAITAYNSMKITANTPIKLSIEQIPTVEGALVSVETETGDLVALVGGYNFAFGNQFNRGSQAKRQPGSAFKPIVYSAALDNGFTAATIIEDAPFVGDRVGPKANTVDLWRPSNVDGIFYGPIMLRTALVRSRNLCTIRLAHRIGIPAIIERANLLGIEGNIPRDLSISLGSYEVTPLALTESYTAFATLGKRVRPRMIRHITNSWGEPIVTFVPEKIDTLSPQNAYIISSILKDVITGGTGRRARDLERIVAGKTGTTNDERDAWFIGFSPYLVSTVYVGYDDRTPMGKYETGARVSVPIFAQYRKNIEKLYPNTDFPVPQGIKIINIDASNGLLAGLYSEHVLFMPFITGTEPKVIAGEPLGRGDDDIKSGADLFKQ